MSDHPDIKGYYSILHVSQSATRTEIRRAFRERAKLLHPDTNHSASATEEFQKVNEAHRILADEKSRRDYDQDCRSFEAEREAERARQRATQQASAQRGYRPAAKAAQTERKKQNPFDEVGYVHCDSCNIVTAQPRYLTFYSVVSYFVNIKRVNYTGVYCRDCADRIALKCSLKTWLTGWWFIPYGPFYTIDALVRNLLGGDRPRNKNVSILWQQAQAFSDRGQYDLARAALDQAIDITRDRVDRAKLREARDSLVNGDSEAPKIVNRWGLFGSRAFLFQMMPILALIILALNLTVLPKILNNENQVVAQATVEQPKANFSDAKSGFISEEERTVPFIQDFISPKKQAAATSEIKEVEQVKVAPLQVGDIFVVNSTTKLREGPSIHAKVVEDLKAATAVSFAYDLTGSWYMVQTMDGVTGYVQQYYLSRLATNKSLLNQCASNPGTIVENGDVLLDLVSGENVLNIDNSSSPYETVVQVRSSSGALLKSVYTAPYQKSRVTGVPKAELMLWYQTGRDYARNCGRFIENYHMARAPQVYQFRPTGLGYKESQYFEINFLFDYDGMGTASGFRVFDQ